MNLSVPGENAPEEPLLPRIRATWPGLTWSSVSVPDQGMDHEVVVLHGALFSAVLSGGAHGADSVDSADLVVRAPRTEAYRAQAPVEAEVLRLLDADADPSALRLPTPVLSSADSALHAQRYIAGETLTPELWTQLPGKARERIIDQLAELMRLLHSADVSSSPVDRVEAWWTPGGGINRISPRVLPAKAELVRERVSTVLEPRLESSDLYIVHGILDDVERILSTQLGRENRRLVHSDLYDSHLLWDGESIGVIDFSDMNLGDPALDYAHLFALDPVLPRLVAERAGDLSDGLDDGFADGRSAAGRGAGLLDRAWTYARWDAVFLLIDHFRTGHTPGAVAWEVFGRARAADTPG